MPLPEEKRYTYADLLSWDDDTRFIKRCGQNIEIIFAGKRLGILLSEGTIMKTAALIMGIIFLILTFAGAGYVFINHGQVNAGYAVIPSLWTIICFGYYQKRKE